MVQRSCEKISGGTNLCKVMWLTIQDSFGTDQNKTHFQGHMIIIIMFVARYLKFQFGYGYIDNIVFY